MSLNPELKEKLREALSSTTKTTKQLIEKYMDKEICDNALQTALDTIAMVFSEELRRRGLKVKEYGFIGYVEDLELMTYEVDDHIVSLLLDHWNYECGTPVKEIIEKHGVKLSLEVYDKNLREKESITLEVR